MHMCEGMHILVHMHVEASDQYWVSSLITFYVMFWVRVSH